MEKILFFFEGIDPVLAAFYATLFTWGLTALGASLVFFVKSMNRALLDGLLGFTGGVMVAASFWSLLAPGIEMSPGEGFVKVIPAAVGFGLGALFIFGLDKVLPHIHINFKESEGIKTPWHKTTLLVLAITLHNIPEGLCVACPIYSATGSVWEATKLATLSGLTEPIGALMALFVFSGVNDNGLLEVILNYVLVFVGGVMLSVSIRELIPEAIASGHVESMKKGFVGGALVMGITMYVL